MSYKRSKFNTPLKGAKNHGSAQDGLHHWIIQRITAIALIPLAIWLVTSLICLAGAEYMVAAKFFHSPFNAVMAAGLVIAAFWHASLGLQVIIEDYISCKCAKITALLFVKIGAFGLAIACLMAIAKLALA